MQLTETLFYPIRTHIDRAIIYTKPEEMMSRQCYRGTLYERLDELESAIVQGEAVELFRCRNPHQSSKTQYIQIYPLQLVYSDIAWYLLHEDCQTQHLALSRIDRLSDHFKTINEEKRSLKRQLNSVETAHRLLESGWGRNLGTVEDQKLEKQGLMPLTEVIVRFFPEAMLFILEGEKRHLSQEIREGLDENGKTAYVDYVLKLPKRSFNEFCYWVCRFMGNAQFIAPIELIEKHKEMAQNLIIRYSNRCPKVED